VADQPARRRCKGRIEADESHHDERQPRHQDRLQQAEVELLAELTDLEEADRDRHRKDEQRRNQHPEVVDRVDHIRLVPLPRTNPS
jgi:hypothetical protein